MCDHASRLKTFTYVKGGRDPFSAWDTAGTRNLFFDAQDRFRLSPTAYHFLAGVLAHLPGLVALTCPSVNSYRRLRPQAWSSAFICYGPDNREAALRIPSPFWGNDFYDKVGGFDHLVMIGRSGFMTHAEAAKDSTLFGKMVVLLHHPRTGAMGVHRLVHKA